MKSPKLSTMIGGLLLLAVLYWFITKRNQPEELPAAQAPPLPIAPPGSNGTTSTGSPSTVPILDPDSSPALEAINNRVLSIYSNQSAREAVYTANQIRAGIFDGIRYRQGIIAVLSEVLPDRNPLNIPIIPPAINLEYQQRLKTLQEVNGYEAIVRNSSNDVSAKQTWANASDMGSAGFSFWPAKPVIDAIMNQGLFYVSGPADRNQSERFDSYTTDLKRLAKNIEEANRKAQDALRTKAIQDLRAAGWRFVGFDFAQTATA